MIKGYWCLLCVKLHRCEICVFKIVKYFPYKFSFCCSSLPACKRYPKPRNTGMLSLKSCLLLTWFLSVIAKCRLFTTCFYSVHYFTMSRNFQCFTWDNFLMWVGFFIISVHVCVHAQSTTAAGIIALIAFPLWSMQRTILQLLCRKMVISALLTSALCTYVAHFGFNLAPSRCVLRLFFSVHALKNVTN